jgi:hypothetical protein
MDAGKEELTEMEGKNFADKTSLLKREASQDITSNKYVGSKMDDSYEETTEEIERREKIEEKLKLAEEKMAKKQAKKMRFV